MHVYISEKCYVYILNKFININNKYRHVNTYKYFQNIYCVYLYIYIHNKYTEHTHILCKQKLLFCMQLIAINCLTALIFLQLLIIIYVYYYCIEYLIYFLI